MSETKLLLGSALLHLTSDEREAAMNMLAIIGLHAYSEAVGDLVVDINSLNKLFGKYKQLVEIKVSEAHKHPGLDRKPKVPLCNIAVKDYRISRPDSLAHFPFIDNYGSVTDVLHEDPNTRVHFEDIGEPGQRRLASKVFDEFKCGKSGIRLRDVPEAVRSLGLTMSAKMERQCLGTSESSNAKDANDITPDYTITLEQWIKLLKKVVKSRQGRSEGFDSFENNPKSQNNEIPKSANNANVSNKQNNVKNSAKTSNLQHPTSSNPYIQPRFVEDDTSTVSVYDSSDISDSIENRFRTFPQRSRNQRTHRAEYNVDPYYSELSRVKQRRAVSANRSRSPLVVRETHTSRLRKVQSRIQDEVRRDRKQYDSEHRDQHVDLERRRNEQIAARNNEKYFAEHPGAHYYQRSDPRPSTTQEKRGQGRVTNGGALDIANAFIRSDLGREFARYPDNCPQSAFDDFQSLDSQTQSSDNDGNAVAKSGKEPTDIRQLIPDLQRASDYQPSLSLSHAHMQNTLDPRVLKAIVNRPSAESQEGKDAVGSGWRSRHGGWVADFGKPHTFTVNTIPQNNLTTEELAIKPWNRIERVDTTSVVSDDFLKAASYDIYKADETDLTQASDMSVNNATESVEDSHPSEVLESIQKSLSINAAVQSNLDS